MKKKFIVKSNDEFNTIINTCRYMVVYYCEKREFYSRFGISVGKKIGNAVTRNKLKRRMRNIIDCNKNLFKSDKDYIIIIRKGFIIESFENLSISFLSLINKINK